jgi:hypothetical protein
MTGPSSATEPPFPIPLTAYTGEDGLGLVDVLVRRATQEPLNLVATGLFLGAIVHTFLAPSLLAASHHLRTRLTREHGKDAHSATVEILHLLGEVEVVFGIWAVPLLVTLAVAYGARAPEAFLQGLHFAEPVFVIVIMAIASTRPVLAAAERLLGIVARLGGGSPRAWWLSTLTIGPLLGSFITEPAAMVICAAVLSRKVLDLSPSPRLRYATLGLLFVDVSVGGTLTDFAAPPVLMVAERWGWDTRFMFTHFGWRAAVGILVSNGAYLAVFWRELGLLALREGAAAARERGSATPIPPWISAANLAFLGLAVFAARTPAFVVGILLFFLAFQVATAPHQQRLDLRAPLLVGFFLAGLVIHGAGQQWWIAPVLSRLQQIPLFVGATVLTAFNDNAAITYLASLVPSFSADLQYAVVAGAVTGGGLTVIANAPNPAGQAALARHFPEGVSPSRLLAAALLPTAVMAACFISL